MNIKIYDTATGETEIHQTVIQSWKKSPFEAAKQLEQALHILHPSWGEEEYSFKDWGFIPFMVAGTTLMAQSNKNSWCGDGHRLTATILEN